MWLLTLNVMFVRFTYVVVYSYSSFIFIIVDPWFSRTSKSTDGCVSCGSLGGQDCSLIMAKRDWSQATSHFKSTTTGQRLVGLLHETWVDVSPSKSLERWYHLVVGARLNGAVSEFTGGQGYCTVYFQDHSGLNLPL